jgi:thiamine biosynthesis lipoprotein
MERAGFDTNYQTGEHVSSSAQSAVSFRDVSLDRRQQTVTLLRPLSLDLGAVAKGLAIDLAGQELAGLDGFMINAGGDILANGTDANGESWLIGLRHPRRPSEVWTSLRIDGDAVCTSGDYERVRETGDGHHILNPSDGTAAAGSCSVTVIAPTAMAADALSTAAFVLGVGDGLELLQREGVDGIIVGADLSVAMTPGAERYAWK